MKGLCEPRLRSGGSAERRHLKVTGKSAAVCRAAATPWFVAPLRVQPLAVKTLNEPLCRMVEVSHESVA